jgi:NAD(P)-dependent dehydrogenase (short-subunit alcohol dehydrogenase family)/pimeloyl-ACP methyl ester carboxylesterase
MQQDQQDQALRSRTVDTGDARLAVTERGEAGRPPVLLVHGYPDTGAVWDEVAAQLTERFHVITYDVRGSGRSSAPADADGYKLSRLIADLRAVIDAVSPDRPVHLVGHDWGALQCWAALTDPGLAGRVSSYTALGTPPLDHVSAWLRRRARHGPSGLADVLNQAARSWYIGFFQLPAVPELAWRAGLGRLWGQALAAGEGIQPRPGHPAETLTRDAVNGIALYRANMTPGPRSLGLGRPGRTPRPVDVPVQLVVTTRDLFIAPRTQESVTGHVPLLWRRRIRAKHWVQRTHPDQIAAWVAEFADHIDGAPASPALRRADASHGSKPFGGYLVVITGAGSGIGKATALGFAANGAEVVAADIDLAAAERTSEIIRGHGGTAHPYQVDVTKAGEMERFAGWVRAEHDVPDVVVNNAGIAVAGSFLEHTEDDWQRIVDVNLLGVVRGCRLFGAQMAERARAGGPGGHIVNMASAAAFAPTALLPAYSATKAAVKMLSDCLGAELAPAGIGVTAICPGFTNTAIARSAHYAGADKAREERLRAGASRAIAMRRYPPEKVALAVMRAVRRNRPFVPVNAEAHVGYALSRFAPAATRLLARRSGERELDRLERLAGRDGPAAPAG